MRKLTVLVTMGFVVLMMVVMFRSRGYGYGQGTGGPIILMGIDAEDGGIGGHGPINVYISVVNSILANVGNGGTGILVIGGGKNSADEVTEFWDAIDAAIPTQTVTYVNGAANIAAQSFAGFAMIAVVSDEENTFSGGLTQAEHDALTARRNDIAAFVNGGGGLLGFMSEFANPFAYLATIGNFVIINQNYSDITPTADGAAIGITDALDVTAWHQVFQTFPNFLKVLATDVDSGLPAAIGGQQVIVSGGEGPDLTGSWTNGITQRCFRAGSRRRCQITGKLRVQNIGTKVALSSVVKYYCSTDNTFSQNDTFLGQGVVGLLRPQQATTISFNITLPAGTDVSGKFIIAVIDSTSVVQESNEGNNQAVTGPVGGED